MPSKRRKPIEVSKADWEAEVPELTEEQLDNQSRILKSLGRSVMSDSKLKEQKSGWVISNFEVLLSEKIPWKLPEPTDDEDI